LSIFKRLIKRVFGEPRKLNDEFFGELIDADGYYEGYADFNPIKDKIEIGISGDENGPSAEARSFYKQVEKDYYQLVKIISPKILERLIEWEPNVKIKDFDNEFKPVYLFIPDFNQEDQSWEIAFESIHNSHLITLVMSNYEVEFVRFDG